MLFPHGRAVTLLRRSDGAAVVVGGCAVAPRAQPESPVPSWPPLAAGREVYAPVGTAVSPRDRMVVDGVTYEVDGEPEDWGNPFTGTQFGVRIYLRRTDNWYDTTVSIRTYLGSAGFGPIWAETVEWPASIVAVAALNESATGEVFDSQVQVRVPPENDGTEALSVFVPGSEITVAGATSIVSAVQPMTRDGFVEFVEVTGR